MKLNVLLAAAASIARLEVRQTSTRLKRSMDIVMGSSQNSPWSLFCQAIDDDNQPLGSYFSVRINTSATIGELKEVIHGALPKAARQCFEGFNPADLALWKLCKNPSPKTFKCELAKLQFSDPDDGHEVQLLDPVLKIGEYWDSEPPKRCFHLLVRASQELLMSREGMKFTQVKHKLFRRYQDTFIKVESFECWTETDLLDNGIYAEDVCIPEFVAQYERMLTTPRRVPENLLQDNFAEKLLGPYLGDYCTGPAVAGPNSADPTLANPDTNVNVMTEEELIHLAQLARVQPLKWWLRKGHGRSRSFKQPDVNWLLLFAVASPYKTGESESGISVKMESIPWSFRIIVQDLNEKKNCRSYQPKNDFTVLVSSLPRLLLEVNSFPREQEPQDRYRMLLQAASVIRFANNFLQAYNKEKNYILVAAFVDDDGEVDRYIMFQDKNRYPRNVYFKRANFKLAEGVDRIRFARELYNFFSALGQERHDGKQIKAEIKALQSNIQDYQAKFGLPLLTSHRKYRRTDWAGNHISENCDSGGSSGAEHLKIHGYVVIPDSFETKGGLFQRLGKLPTNIRHVYRSTDATRTELVAKHVDEDSFELEVLEYLRTIQPQSSHIIPLIDTIPTNTGTWAIFPKMHTLSMCSDSLLRGRCAQFGCDLIEGLAYLHEHGVAHLDIKPANLVYTADFRLQIIDFDSAVQVKSEDDMIEGIEGTPGWMAPEVQEGSMFSPIRADRWSCGKVLLYFLKESGTKDKELKSFAGQLMDDNPLHRPSLVDWPNVTFCEVHEDGVDEVKKMQAQVKDDIGADSGLEHRTKRRRVDAKLG